MRPADSSTGLLQRDVRPLATYLNPPVAFQGSQDLGSLRHLLARPADEVGDRLGGFGFHRGDRVAVDVHREGDGGVTKSFAHDLGMDAGAEGQGRVRVPQVMQPDARQVSEALSTLACIDEQNKASSNNRSVLS